MSEAVDKSTLDIEYTHTHNSLTISIHIAFFFACIVLLCWFDTNFFPCNWFNSIFIRIYLFNVFFLPHSIFLGSRSMLLSLNTFLLLQLSPSCIYSEPRPNLFTHSVNMKNATLRTNQRENQPKREVQGMSAISKDYRHTFANC